MDYSPSFPGHHSYPKMSFCLVGELLIGGDSKQTFLLAFFDFWLVSSPSCLNRMGRQIRPMNLDVFLNLKMSFWPVCLRFARPATCDLRPATCDMRPATCDMRLLLFVLLSRNMQPAIGRMSQVADCSFWCRATDRIISRGFPFKSSEKTATKS